MGGKVVWVELWFSWVAYVGLVLVVAAVAVPRLAIAAATVAGITGRGSVVLRWITSEGGELGPGLECWLSAGHLAGAAGPFGRRGLWGRGIRMRSCWQGFSGGVPSVLLL